MLSGDISSPSSLVNTSLIQQSIRWRERYRLEQGAIEGEKIISTLPSAIHYRSDRHTREEGVSNNTRVQIRTFGAPDRLETRAFIIFLPPAANRTSVTFYDYLFMYFFFTFVPNAWPREGEGYDNNKSPNRVIIIIFIISFPQMRTAFARRLRGH